MLTLTVLLLTAAGMIAATTAINGLIRDNRARRTTPICGAWSPDIAICCIRPAGHTGWHAHDQLEWIADAWNASSGDNTKAAPAIIGGITMYQPLPENADPDDIQRVKNAKKKGR